MSSNEVSSSEPGSNEASSSEISSNETNSNEIDLKQVIHNQPTMIIGTIGGVSNGKSTITERLTFVKTQKSSGELERNITIKLGHANGKIFKCSGCEAPQCYQPFPDHQMTAKCNICGGEMQLKKHYSIVDCPGHYQLMSTMMNGTAAMDTSMLVVAMNSSMEGKADDDTSGFPDSQTLEHLNVAKIINLKNSVVCVNKIDLIRKKAVASEKIKKLEELLKDTVASKSPIIPVVANPIANSRGINIDYLCQTICETIEEPKRDLDSGVKMIIIRSYNINQNNVKISDLAGGVVGGTLTRGVLKVGEEVRLLPGYIKESKVVDPVNDPRWSYKPLVCRVESIQSEKTSLKFAVPGALVGVNLTLDPALTAKDRLVGNILIANEDKTEYKVYESLMVQFESITQTEKDNLKVDDVLAINSNATNVRGEVKKIKKDKLFIQLTDKPICTSKGDYITISRLVDPKTGNITLLGRGIVLDGFDSKLSS